MRKFLLLMLAPLFMQAQDVNNRDFISENSFIENKGQFDGRNWQKDSKIKYGVDYNKAFIFFTEKGLTYRFDKIIRNPNRDKSVHDSPKRTNISELIHVEWIGANSDVEIIAEEKISAYYSYAIKNLETKEVKNENYIPGYKKLTYKNIYDNIDVEYIIQPETGIKYSIILHPGADVSKVKMKYSKGQTSIGQEQIIYGLDEAGELQIKTFLGEITEHKPLTYYSKSKKEVSSSFKFENDILSFNLGNFDNTKEIVIDPWVQSPNFNSSTAVWEVETDGTGNVYVIGGETPMELRKYNSAGTWQWTYTTPWDTATVWLGTLATDAGGVSYITSGTTPEIERVTTAGGMVWHNSSFALFSLTEWWSIAFNCDKTKLIVGGTGGMAPPLGTPLAVIYNMDINNGNVLNMETVHTGGSGGLMDAPIEVRSISSSKDAKYIFLTHIHVGAINDNIGACPSSGPIYKVDNGHHLGYKCENYLPATQNGGGLKALIANDQYFYTNSGNQVHQRNLSDGSLITSVALPGGNSSTVPLIGGLVVENSGLAVDDCGNVYAGSGDRVVKFDANLNILSQVNVPFTVYDVSVNSNGEVIAVGAQNANDSIARHGKIQALNMTACAQFALVCCDVNICPVDTVCDDDPAFNILVSSPGGTFSGTGITNTTTGTFDPAVAGVGSHVITYTKPCGFETVTIVVDPCDPITICYDGTNLIATGGTGTIIWEDWVTFNYSITNEQECIDCPMATPIYFMGFYTGCSTSTCSGTDWVQFGTGNTVAPPANWPMQVSDNNGVEVTYNNLGEVPPCSACTSPTLSATATHVTCSGGSNGAIDVTVTPGSGSSYTYSWTGPGGYTSTSLDINSLIAGTYTITVTDAVSPSCFAILSVIVNPGMATDDASFTVSNYCQGAVNSATITGTPGGTFSFNPVPTNGETINSSTGAITGGIGGNTYTIQYTTNGVCPASSTQTVSVYANPVPSISGSSSFCTGGSTTLDAGAGYTIYSWSPSGNTQTINVNTAGTYIVTVTDNNGCSGTNQIVVTVTANLTPNITGVLSICSGAATTLDAGSGYANYLWSNGAVTQTINVTTAGTYSVTVTSASCVGSGVELVTNGDFELGNTGFTTDYLLCAVPGSCGMGDYIVANNGSVHHSAWTCTDHTSGTGNLMIFDGSTTAGTNAWCQTVTVTPGTDYTFSCWASAMTNWWNLNPADLHFLFNGIDIGNIITPLNPVCGWNQFTGNWNSGINTTVNICIIDNDVEFGGNDFGLDDISLQTCTPCTGTASVNVSLNNNPTPTITGSLSFCTGSSTILDAGAGYTAYSWSPSGATQTISVNTAGTYSVTVTDNNGCTGTDQVNVTVAANLTPGITGVLTICNGASTTLSASIVGSNISYLWSTSATTQSINVTTAGTYSLTVSDVSGCTGTDQVDVTTNSNPIPNITGALSFCTGGSTTLDAGTYTSYIWSTGGNSQTINVTTAGTYIVTVTDANGCTGTDQVDVTVAANLTPAITGVLSICSGAATTLDAGSGYSTYIWSTTDITQTIPVTIAGTYSVTVSDASGCTGTDQVNVTTNTNPTPVITGALSFCTGSSTILDAGAGYIGYSWSPSGNTQTITVNAAGTYSVTVIDANGCYGSTQVDVIESSSIIATLTPTNILCNGDASGAIDVTLSGGSAPYTFLWSNNATTQDLSSITAGTYQVTVTDNNGCSTIESIALTEPSAIAISTSSDAYLCNGQTVILSASVTGGTPPLSYYWNGVLGTANHVVGPSSTTYYQVYAVDINGCISQTNTIYVYVLPNVDLELSANTDHICPGDEVLILPNISPGIPPYYLYDDQGLVINPPMIVYPMDTTTYFVYVEDQCGSVASDEITIYTYPLPPVFFSADTMSGCQPLTVQFNSQYTAASYVWNFGDNDFDNLSFDNDPVHIYDNPGTFTVNLTVTSEEGCENSYTVENMIIVYKNPEAKFINEPEAASIIKPIIYFFNLSSGHSISYWNFGDGYESNQENPFHTYPIYPTGIYNVMLVVESDMGCVDTTYKDIIIQNEYTFYAPTAFSPDFDGINDIFLVYGNGIDKRNFKMIIYDRWGEPVFETEDLYQGWDGRINGGETGKIGTYTWLVIFKDIRGIEREETGAVSIIR
ncbi:MAG: PKD domain-containing protein [Bacteroidota bacterium]